MSLLKKILLPLGVLAFASWSMFHVVGPSAAEVTVNLPVERYDPLTGECVAFEQEEVLVRCENAPEKYRRETTFPRATFEDLLTIHNM
ncbi:hypothetical protein H6785_00890 [Candidatus Nomurabacteria bacterium]|nr:hypothetical protein [Candidatus Nomurabacteria bacterium]